MRHGKSGRRLNRSSAHRKAMLANLAAALIKHEQINTTLAKAKELRPVAERLIQVSAIPPGDGEPMPSNRVRHMLSASSPMSRRPGRYHSIDQFIIPNRFRRAIEMSTSCPISPAAWASANSSCQ